MLPYLSFARSCATHLAPISGLYGREVDGTSMEEPLPPPLRSRGAGAPPGNLPTAFEWRWEEAPSGLESSKE